ncbi:DUF6975 family protein [uncultured Sphingomonas sp.]|uniref:DUF6975 family protein n=1 Tax=uncultured Sphingomonas sp. TaxID=158754 RepID=UPI0035CA9BF6
MLTQTEQIAAVPPSLASLVVHEGTASSSYVDTLCAPRAPTRHLSDAVHAVCLLHGHHPGLVDHAAARAEAVPDWLPEAASSFAAERAWLAGLVAAAGPLPSTPGQAEAEATISGQRHAFDMLAGSDRAGCALGAVAALLLDWVAIHRLLDVAALRFGVVPQPYAFVHPGIVESHRRAALFAGQQVLAQHRGLWQLLESRAAARGR